MRTKLSVNVDMSVCEALRTTADRWDLSVSGLIEVLMRRGTQAIQASGHDVADLLAAFTETNPAKGWGPIEHSKPGELRDVIRSVVRDMRESGEL